MEPDSEGLTMHLIIFLGICYLVAISVSADWRRESAWAYELKRDHGRRTMLLVSAALCSLNLLGVFIMYLSNRRKVWMI